MQNGWFAVWFDSPHYHQLYAHRNDAEAAGFIDALTARLRPRAKSRMLDLGCGTGRHARHLASKGYDVTGIDLSASSLAMARRAGRPHLAFRRQDMRRPFGRRTFDYVFNFFTSFGYFDTPGDHEAVVRNIAVALKADGRLVLDYLNVPYADARLTPREDAVVDGATFRITRTVEGGCFVKRVVVDDGRGGSPAQYVERVARFTLADFDRLFRSHGLAIEEVYGTYGLGAYDPHTSPRLILVARKGTKLLVRRGPSRSASLLQLPAVADAADRLGRDAEV